MTTGKDHLKPSEIADLAGLKEDEVREYIAAYPDLFPYRSIGPVRLYAPKAVETARKCAEAAREGRRPEETVREAAPAVEAETAPSPVTQAYLDARDLKDVVARQEQQIEALRREMEAREGALLDRIAALEGALMREQKQTALVAEWIDYFDAEIERLRRPLLGRIFEKKS
jgi:DNA-binding transcriptional MerR regulator